MARGKKVAILRGGPSREHDVSLQSASEVRRSLEESPHALVDIYIDRQGRWYREGVERPVDRALSGVDFVFNAMHGEYGEDGVVQQILDHHHLPYNGAGVHASRIAFSKNIAKRHFQKVGLFVPGGEVITSLHEIEAHLPHGSYRHFHKPLIVKPLGAGSSVGVTLVRSYHDAKNVIKHTVLHHGPVLVEEAIIGREATVGVVEGVFGDSIVALPPVEIVPPEENEFFDHNAKYSGASQEICPGRFDKGTVFYLQEAAIAAHKALGLRHYSRSDFIIPHEGDIRILETNTLPGLTKESLFPKSLAAHGSSLREFLLSLIN